MAVSGVSWHRLRSDLSAAVWEPSFSHLSPRVNQSRYVCDTAASIDKMAYYIYCHIVDIACCANLAGWVGLAVVLHPVLLSADTAELRHRRLMRLSGAPMRDATVQPMKLRERTESRLVAPPVWPRPASWPPAAACRLAPLAPYCMHDNGRRSRTSGAALLRDPANHGSSNGARHLPLALGGQLRRRNCVGEKSPPVNKMEQTHE